MQKTTPLEPGKYYHIYNRGNNGENIFIEERNYTYFMNLYARYIDPVAETFSYCLLRNHFHVGIRIKEDLGGIKNPGQPFANLFNAYSKAISRAYGRTGSLFENRYRRKEVTTDRYFQRLINLFIGILRSMALWRTFAIIPTLRIIFFSWTSQLS